jgi:hypothetical protein
MNDLRRMLKEGLCNEAQCRRLYMLTPFVPAACIHQGTLRPSSGGCGDRIYWSGNDAVSACGKGQCLASVAVLPKGLAALNMSSYALRPGLGFVAENFSIGLMGGGRCVL